MHCYCNLHTALSKKVCIELSTKKSIVFVVFSVEIKFRFTASIAGT